MLRVIEPRETSFGSMLYYSNDGRKHKQEFTTDSEANEFADELRKEMERIDEQCH